MMKTKVFALALLTGGCADSGPIDGGESDTDASGSSGCTDECSGTTDDTGASTGDSGSAGGSSGCDDCGGSSSSGTGAGTSGGTTGDGSTGGTSGSTSAGGSSGGATGGGVMCETNFDCTDVEVCSVGLGECIAADGAEYEVTVSSVVISGGALCAGDPDEKNEPCMQEIYVKAFVGNTMVDESQPIVGVGYGSVVNYQFLVNFSATEPFTFEIWDSDDNGFDPWSEDDLLLTREFDTPATVLHGLQLSDTWMDGSATKELVLEVRAQ